MKEFHKKSFFQEVCSNIEVLSEKNCDRFRGRTFVELFFLMASFLNDA